MIRLESHPGVDLINPKIERLGTFDDHIKKTFTPTIVFVVEPNIRIAHNMPAQPYVNGTWEDEDVENAIQEYIKSIEVK